MSFDQYSVASTATSIQISWDSQHAKSIALQEIEKYETKYRQSGGSWNTLHKSHEGESEITGLIPDTSYEINVYWCGESGDATRLFTTRCKTKESKSSFLKDNALADKSTRPIVYHLNPVHIAEYEVKVKTENNVEYLRNEDGTCIVDRFRVCDMISDYKPGIQTCEEKTLLLLGATGTGKSTFVEALINYIANVSFNDDHRFAIINKTNVEKERVDEQSQSQTTSVTVYRIPKVDGFQVDYQLNIIDTPGFNDTRENFDKRIIEQIRELFQKKIGHLDAILVVIPLSQTRLTEAQKEVFSNITRMFGEDIAQNILIAITWDDGGEETCLTVLRNAKIPINDTFRFNNASVLVKYPSKASQSKTADETREIANVKVKETWDMSDKKVEETEKISESMHSFYMGFWERRNKSFSEFFNKLEKIQRTTVESSVEVMRSRINLEIRLASLRGEITEQAQLIANFIEDMEILYKIEHETPENKKKAQYTMIEIEMHPKFYSKSSLNCKKCRKTCHKNCWVPITQLKRTCEAMTNKKCTVCEGKCGLNDHSLEKYVYEPQPMTKMYSGEDVINRQKEREKVFLRFKQTLGDTGDLIDLLDKKALEKNDLTLSGFIQDLISKENEDEKLGFEMRIKLLGQLCDFLKRDEPIWKMSMACLS